MIKNVILMGGVAQADDIITIANSSLVSNKIINCYSEQDWVLKYVHLFMSKNSNL